MPSGNVPNPVTVTAFTPALARTGRFNTSLPLISKSLRLTWPAAEEVNVSVSDPVAGFGYTPEAAAEAEIFTVTMLL